MSELKKYWLFLSVGLLAIVAVGSTAWFSGCVAQTGTLGDTLGGIFSPIIGLFSAVLIYETFKAQRAQLADQAAANTYSRSSFFYSELKQLFENARDHVYQLSFTLLYPKVETYTGINAVQHFVVLYQQNHNTNIGSSGMSLIRSIVSQLNSTLSVAQKASVSSGLITDDDLQSLMQFHISGLISIQLQSYERLFDVIRDRLRHIRRQGFVEGQTDDEATDLFLLFKGYYSVMENFVTLGYLRKLDFGRSATNAPKAPNSALDTLIDTLDLESHFTDLPVL